MACYSTWHGGLGEQSLVQQLCQRVLHQGVDIRESERSSCVVAFAFGGLDDRCNHVLAKDFTTSEDHAFAGTDAGLDNIKDICVLIEVYNCLVRSERPVLQRECHLR